MLKLSYIIPAYNASAYIQQTLDGIFALPLSQEELEVIVIDDCSTDDTLEILRAIQQKHPNLIVLRQEWNQRQGAARNRGIAIARGEYIAFCDADDEIVAEGVMNALLAVEKSQADICYFDFEYQVEDGEWRTWKMPKETRNTILPAKEYLNKYYTCGYNAPWRCLYKTDFLRSSGVRFIEGVRWEDCDWTVKVYAKASDIQFVDGVGYRYTYNVDATSKQSNAQAMAEQLNAGVRLIVYARQIKNTLPGLSKTLFEEGEYRYIKDNIRNLVLYSASYLQEVYSSVSQKCWYVISTLNLSRWEKIVVKHHFLAICSLFLLRIAYLLKKKLKCIYKHK